jgi:hypothetical protein
MTTGSNKKISRLIERSSLGTRSAKSARTSVSASQGKALARAATARAAARTASSRNNGNDGVVRV